MSTLTLLTLGTLWMLEICGISSLSAPHRYRARVAYLGTGFQGFQIQEGSDARTVQGDLEHVLSQRLNEPIRVVAAGRTDAGVHARGQAVHFDAHQELSDVNHLAKVQKSVEKMLPNDIAFWNLQKTPPPVTKIINGHGVPAAWNVIYDSTQKLYSYRLCVAPCMDPLERYRRWHPDSVHQWFDETRFCRLVKCYEGSHDFRAFASDIEKMEKQLNSTLGTVRKVHSVNVIKEKGDGNYRIDFLIKGALYKQVRNMVGTALEVCRGSMEEERFHALIHNNDGALSRSDNRAKPAPPEGLTLEHVYFDDDDEF